MKPTLAQLVTSLTRTTVCPACGKAKKLRQTFCLSDYRRLPKELRDALWAGVGHGYEEAVDEALKYLNVQTPFWPKEEQ